MKTTKFQKFTALLLAVIMLASFTPSAFAEGEGAPADNGSVVVTLGTNRPLTVTAQDLGAESIPAGAVYTWSNTQPALVAVEGSGADVTLVPKKAGQAVISVRVTAADGTRVGDKSWLVDVKYAETTGIILVPTEFSLDTVDSSIPKERDLTPSLTPPGLTDPRSLVWSTEPEGIVQLNDTTDSEEAQTMRVTPLKPGVATITVKSGKYSASSKVTVIGIVMSQDSVEVPLGSTYQLSTEKFGNITSEAVWSSGNENVAEVSQDGLVTANSLGSAQIIATAGRYTAVCEVVVVENTANTIECETEAGRPFSFGKIMDALDECARDQLKGKPLSYITSVRTDTSFGVLYYRYVSSNDTGFGVGAVERYYFNSRDGSRAIEDITFVPRAGVNSTAEISYIGYDDSGHSFTGHIKITVTGDSDIEYATDALTPVGMHADDFSQICRQRNGRDFTYVSFYLPSENQGTLYYNYSSENLYSSRVDSVTQYKRSGSPYLENVAFVPNKDYSGVVRIAYRGEDTVGLAFSGTMLITVTPAGGLNSSSINYTVYGSEYVPFIAEDFDNVCQAETGSKLDYVRFSLPDKSQGELYYGYHGTGSYGSRVTESERYYLSRDFYLNNVSFVPVSGYEGAVYIDFTGYSVNGDRFSGQVCVHIAEGGAGNNVAYATRQGQAVSFSPDNFNEFCQELTGETLFRVQFTNPSGSQGSLTYSENGTAGVTVTPEMNFYRSGSGEKLISGVSFVPARTVTGTVRLSYKGYSQSGRQYSGTVYISVEPVDSFAVKYTAVSGGTAVFSGDDFNEACSAGAGASLNYIRFSELPESAGTLYSSYSGGSGTAASVNTNYYYKGTQSLIGSLTFKAAAGFTGTVEFGYTGTASNGRTFEGAVQIRVKMPEADPIQYAGSANPIEVNPNNFERVSVSVTGDGISSIQFTKLPGEAGGRLYYNYSSPVMTGTPVSVGTSYYFDSAPQISRLRFVPKSGYTGRVTAEYTGYTASGQRFTGTVVFIMSPEYGNDRFTDMGNYGWANQSVDFLYSMGVVNGVGSGRYAPGSSILRRDFVLMLCNAFRLDTGGGAPFPDVPQDSYYALAVSTARALGIIQGSDGYFRPDRALTRQDAMVMIWRTLNTLGIRLPDTSGLNISSFSDSGQVSGYAREAVDGLVRSGIIIGSGGRINPGSNITRAEMAVILHRVLTT